MTETGFPCWRWFGLLVLVSLLVACAPTRSSVPPPGTALPTPTHYDESTLTPAPLVRYTDPALGFAVDYPADWEIRTLPERTDPLAPTRPGVEFRTSLYGHGEQVFGKYVATVAAGVSMGQSLTETTEYGLSPIAPSMREGIDWTCCLEVGGEPTVELLLPWPMGGRWGSRQLVVIHDRRAYWLTFYPLQMLDGGTPSDAAARAAFDTFLRTFTFIPITATVAPPNPTVTPAATPAHQTLLPALSHWYTMVVSGQGFLDRQG